MKTAINFREEPLGKLILKLSIPAFLALVMNLLYGFIDGIFIGKGINSLALGGVTIVFPLTIIVISFASMAGEGMASIIARAIAGGKKREVRETIKAGQAVTLWISLVLILITIFNVESIMSFLGATENLLDYSADYYRALLIGFPFMGLSLVYFHQLNAQGEMRIAMRAMILSTLVNIILDYFAIFQLRMGIAGAGYATAISQMIWYFYMHIHAVKNGNVHTVIHPFSLRFSLSRVREIFVIGFSSFVRQVGISIAMILINSMAGRYGSSIHIVSFGAAQRIIRLMIAPIAALSTAMKPIIGQNFGFGEFTRVKTSMKYSFTASAIMGIFLLMLIVVLREKLGFLFGIDSEQMDVFVRVLLLTSCLFPLYGIQHLTVSYFTSLGKAKEALLLNLFKQIIFLIPLLFILPRFTGIYGLFLAIPAADLLTIVISVFLLNRVRLIRY